MLHFQMVIMAGTVMLAYYFKYTDTFAMNVQGFFCHDSASCKPYPFLRKKRLRSSWTGCSPPRTALLHLLHLSLLPPPAAAQRQPPAPPHPAARTAEPAAAGGG
ncbi:Phospholipid Phosphatase-Related Protein Type 5 [Manis pentadactyla]|nr:Phospholipid Phosphatase-Related Protein Type 5 [Manis pentadactyla]